MDIRITVFSEQGKGNTIQDSIYKNLDMICKSFGADYLELRLDIIMLDIAKNLNMKLEISPIGLNNSPKEYIFKRSK